MQSSTASNNHFAALSTIKTPSGKTVLPRITSSGEELLAATGSNAIPIRGNKKSFGKKPMPVNQAQLARPGSSVPRPAPKLSPQVKSYVVPSKRAIALKRAISMPLPKAAESHPSNWRDQFPPLVPRQFLWSPLDQKMNSSSSKSFSHVASKGIKAGSKQSFRSKASSLPSWSETWTTPEDWFSVPANEKNVSPIRNLSAFRATYPVHVPWQVVDEDDDVALGEGRRNGRDTMGKQVLKWLTSLDKYSIEKPKSIEFIDAYGSVDRLYKLQDLAEIAEKRKQFTNDKSVKKRLIESRPSGITYSVKKDKGKGKAKEIYQETLKGKHEAIKKIAEKIIKDVKGVLTFTDSPKLDYKVNRAPWAREEPPSREGLNDWKVDLINSIRAIAPEGDDERNHQQRRAAKFNGLRHKSQSLGPNTSGPYKQQNPTKFFQPRKNSTVKPTSGHPGTTWVNLGMMGWVTHTKQNLVWNIDGYCYLAAINNEGLKN